jgi:Ca2+-transporting ATPase
MKEANDMMTWHTTNVEEALSALGVDSATGLSRDDVRARAARFGPNEIVEAGAKSPWRILWEQFTATMVLILLAAAGISAVVGSLKDTAVILAIVVLFAVLGFVQEYRAERAMVALKRLAAPVVRVRRAGRIDEVPARDLVPGDLVLLEAGNLVPADCRLVEGANLRAQEAALTGESEPVEKAPDAAAPEDAPLGDRRGMLYMGTIVTYGRGTAAVVETGMRTELGRIATMIQRVEGELTPLQKRLDQLGKAIGVIAVAVAVLILSVGLAQGEAVSLMLMTAVSVAVAAVPEGLPAVVTITLALGAQRMLRRQALIRKLPAVETLGSVTVICSDKTGTLTQNRMTVTTLDVAGRRTDLLGHLPLAIGPDEALVLAGAALCNDTATEWDDAAGVRRSLGDPTEVALVEAAAAADVWKGDLEAALPRVAELPFDSERKRMTTVHRVARPVAEIPASVRALAESVACVGGRASGGVEPDDSTRIAFVKGAVDGLLSLSTHVWAGGRAVLLDDARRHRIADANDELAGDGMRVLGVALRVFDEAHLSGSPDALERDLVFVGMAGMIDPPRAEVRDAVATCKAAGIRAVMITGDHPLTARSIARDLGISDGGRALTGRELERMTDEELRGVVEDVSVYARVSPEHKYRIVEALQARGHVVAMTGDGVNDAPALKRANIGVAMGITGTDVSKEAAEMVLRDDNFATIVAAVEEGRVIYDNLRKFIKFSIAGNIGKILVALVGPIAGTPLPLLALQLLWLNLLTDGLLGLGLGVERAERNVMRRPPQSPRAGIFAGGLGRHIAWTGALIGLAALGVGAWYWLAGHAGWQTMIFTTLAFAQVGQALAVRSTHDSLFQIGVLSNRLLAGLAAAVVALQLAVISWAPLREMFGTVPLSAVDLATSAGVGLLVFALLELGKWRARRTEAWGPSGETRRRS